MKIVWTKKAAIQLNDIFVYYRSVGAVKGGKAIVNNIIGTVELLQANPKMGQMEELLQHRPEAFRYLVSGNYKIVYWVGQSEVIIAMVFDSRQNPIKIELL